MTLPVVFVPGTLCDGRVFEAQRRDLAVETELADVTRDDTIDAMAERLLGNAPPEFALVGLSMGGIVAAEALRRAPHRIGGLALVGTNLAPPDEAQIETRTQWAASVEDGRFLDVVDEMIPALTADPGRHRHLITEMAAAVGAAGFLRQNAALVSRPDRRAVVSHITVPTLVACGAEDRLCPPSMHADLAERTAHARLFVVADAGHLTTIDQPAALTSALAEWLELCNNHQSRRGSSHECTTA